MSRGDSRRWELKKGDPLAVESGNYVECQRQPLEDLLEKREHRCVEPGRKRLGCKEGSVASDNKLGREVRNQASLHGSERPLPVSSLPHPPTQTPPG